MSANFRGFRAVFVVGLAIAFTAVLFAWFGRLSVGFARLYLVFALLHVLVLAGLASGLERREKATSVGWLYTAGFLHTLLALGVTIARAGELLAAAHGNLVPVLGSLLAPMAAAVLPHALGVAAGQLLEPSADEQPGAAYEKVVEQLTREAEQGYRSMAALFTEREALLRQELAALQAQVQHWQNATRAVGTMTTRVNALAREIELATQQSQALQTSLQAAAAHGRDLSPALENAVKVVGDLKRLQESIVSLLSQQIFHEP